MALRPLPPLCRRAWQVAVAYTPQSAPPLTAGSPAAPPVRAAFHNGTLIPNLGSPDPKQQPPEKAPHTVWWRSYGRLAAYRGR